MKTLTTLISLFLVLAMAGCSDDDTGTTTQDGGALSDGGVKPDSGKADGMAADQKAKPDAAPGATLKQLAAWMTGGFDSSKQAKANPSYYNITLVMKRTWKSSKKAGLWLYVEQSVTGSQPYRQRVYFLEDLGGGKFSSKVYDFKTAADKTAAIGSWSKDDPLSNLSESDIVEKTGCAVILKWDAAAKKFTGGTVGKKCLSTLSGASYASSRVDVFKGKLTSWDQGFDSNDSQVWGATAGGYVFDLVKDMDTDLAK